MGLQNCRRVYLGFFGLWLPTQFSVSLGYLHVTAVRVGQHGGLASKDLMVALTVVRVRCDALYKQNQSLATNGRHSLKISFVPHSLEILWKLFTPCYYGQILVIKVNSI
jgi:hypothetical protein